MGRHLVDGIEGAVAEMVFPEVFPEHFRWVELWAVGRQIEESDPVGDPEISGNVPSRAIQDDQAMLIRKLVGDMLQEYRHGVGVRPRQNQRDHATIARADRCKRVDVLADDLLRADRPHGQGRPAPAMIADAAEPPFVLEQEADLCR